MLVFYNYHIMKRVVITGLGAITPVGNDIKTFWANMLQGISGAAKITRFDASRFKTQFACEIKNYDAFDYFDKKEMRKLDLFSQYGLIAGDEAIRNAGLRFDQLDTHRIGVIFSTGIGGFETFEYETLRDFNSGSFHKYNPYFITKVIANGISGLISIKHGLRGINSCIVTACASSTQAIILAYNYIKWNKADIIITGGSEAPVTASSVGGFNSMRALSINNDNFKTASRPFDKNRDGFVIGEGAGALVVESLESARKRDAYIYAEITGGGETADAYHITGPHPEGTGAYYAMYEALNEAGIRAEDINYVNAHATSTGLGDLSEARAMKRLFSGSLEKVSVSATKSITGHLLGATGAVEAIATCLSVNTNCIPPTINTNSLDENIPAEIDLTLGKSGYKEITYALSNNFGFGGHCASLLMKKFINN
jgi:3-oxoacyl-[acyl-carrier-protein] synthase II